MEDCKVVFAGTMADGLTGRPLYGDAIDYSFFQWVCIDAAGISVRTRNLFLALGMKMGMPSFYWKILWW